MFEPSNFRLEGAVALVTGAGTVITPGYAEAGLDEKKQYVLAHPDNLTGRAGRPEDIANAFLWLAYPAGSWVSGHTLQVAGGSKRVRLIPE